MVKDQILLTTVVVERKIIAHQVFEKPCTVIVVRRMWRVWRLRGCGRQ